MKYCDPPLKKNDQKGSGRRKYYEFFEKTFLIPAELILIIPNNPNTQDQDDSFSEDNLLVVFGLEFFNMFGLTLVGETDDPYSEKYITIAINPSELKGPWTHLLFEVDNSTALHAQDLEKNSQEKKESWAGRNETH